MESDDSHSGEDQLAFQACASCRAKKRKCDKRLPACSLCVRLRRSCDYTADGQSGPPSAEDFAALRQQMADLQSIITSQSKNGILSADEQANGHIHTSGTTQKRSYSSPESLPWSRSSQPEFPSIVFLDSKLFTHTRSTVRAPHINVPPAALAALGNANDLRDMVEHYFETAHNYLPVVSQIRLVQHLANSVYEPDATLALLFLAMKLVCSPVPDGESPITPLYQEVKSLYQYVEGENGLGIPFIQAGLLIGMYELGHAIYPAAYLTVGNVARVGYASGLHDDQAPQILPRPTTWTEQEERRRLWWGIVILDRFINIGNRGKPFATMDPGIESHLPIDDGSWDKGQMLVAAPLFLSASPTVAASPFARTCQAAYLLGKAVRHIDDSTIPMEYRFDEALQLDRTMRAFADAVESGESPDDGPLGAGMPSTSLAIIYSALLTLYDAYSCTATARLGVGEAQLQMQKVSIEGLRSISDRVLAFVRRVRVGVAAGGLDCVSPLVIDAIYQAGANYAWYVRESSDAICNERFQELQEVLQALQERWKVAGEYHRIVDSWSSSPELAAM